MRTQLFCLVASAALGLSASSVDAMPLGVTSSAGTSLTIVKVADGCGPGLVHGRHGTCLRRPTVFSRNGRRIVRPGCGKPIGAGLRTPC